MERNLENVLTSLKKMLGTVSHKPHLVLNGEYGFLCLGYILGYWLDQESSLWTKNLEKINSNFFLFIHYSFYYIAWKRLCKSSFQANLHACGCSQNKWCHSPKIFLSIYLCTKKKNFFPSLSLMQLWKYDRETVKTHIKGVCAFVYLYLATLPVSKNNNSTTLSTWLNIC